MYRCTNCNHPITTYDVEFRRKLFNRPKEEPCICRWCTRRANKYINKVLDKASDNKDRVRAHIRALLTIISFFVSVNLVHPFGHTNLMFIPLVPLLCSAIFVWKVIATFEFDMLGDSPVGTGEYYYESTVKTDGTIETVRKEETKGGGPGIGCLVNPILFVTYPIWSIPHLLYCLIQPAVSIATKIPKELFPAWDAAEEEAKKKCLSMSIPYDLVKNFDKQKEKYEKQVQKIREKYAVLGVDAVNRHIAEVELPLIQCCINGENFLYLGKGGSGEKLLLHYDKTTQEFEGIKAYESYVLYGDTTNWEKDWASDIEYSKLENDVQRVLTNLSYYKQQLKNM